jgi:hypothetical protein
MCYNLRHVTHYFLVCIVIFCNGLNDIDFIPQFNDAFHQFIDAFAWFQREKNPRIVHKTESGPEITRI